MGTNLNAANLSRAVLRDCILRSATLSATIFRRSDLARADLTGANIVWTMFRNVDLSTVHGLDRTNHLGPSTIGVDTIHLSKGAIPEVFLRNCGVPDYFVDYAHSIIGRRIDFHTCFISYSHTDTLFARRLYDALQVRGIRC